MADEQPQQVPNAHELGATLLRAVAAGTEKPTVPPFPFSWGECWKQTTEYFVEDFESELGFYVGILGFSLVTVSEDYAMVSSPEEDFFLSFRRSEQHAALPSHTMKICFMVQSIERVVGELCSRGVAFQAAPDLSTDSMRVDRFSTPSGVIIELWGMRQQQ